MIEQQFGNFQRTEDMKSYKKEREMFGRFYYRFPDGESGLDVYSRVSSFIGTLFREWAKEQTMRNNYGDSNIIIVTHGLTLRLFLMRWFQFSVEQFESSKNPENGCVVVMSRVSYDAATMQTLLQSPRQNCLETVYSDHFVLDDESYHSLNIPMSVSMPKESISPVERDLTRIMEEAERGYDLKYA